MESVWDYPRPPRVEPSPAHVVVELDGQVLADTRRGLRVLETGHPPVHYIPAADVCTEGLRPSARQARSERVVMARPTPEERNDVSAWWRRGGASLPLYLLAP